MSQTANPTRLDGLEAERLEDLARKQLKEQERLRLKAAHNRRKAKADAAAVAALQKQVLRLEQQLELYRAHCTCGVNLNQDDHNPDQDDPVSGVEFVEPGPASNQPPPIQAPRRSRRINPQVSS